MEKVLRVAVVGAGIYGIHHIDAYLQNKRTELVAVCDLDPNKVGKSIFEILEVDKGDRKDVLVESDYKKVFTEKCADVVLLATDSFVVNAFPKIEYLLKQKVNVISTAEEMAYPQSQSPEIAKEIDRLAKENGVSVLGTGINPGFVLDLLVLALTGTCERVDSIKAVRVNDLSPFGKAVMEEQGVGVTKEVFEKGVKEGTIAGHVGFPESIKMITDGIGWNLEKIEQTREAIMSNVYRKSEYAEVLAGNVAGCRQCGYGYVDGEIKIVMEHPQQILPNLEGIKTGDYVTIKGVPNIDLQITPEIPGGIGTIAMCVNSIPHIINARPGLKTMLDIPVPRAIMGDIRDMIEK